MHTHRSIHPFCLLGFVGTAVADPARSAGQAPAKDEYQCELAPATTGRVRAGHPEAGTTSLVGREITETALGRDSHGSESADKLPFKHAIRAVGTRELARRDALAGKNVLTKQ